MDSKKIKSILQDALEEQIPSAEVDLWSPVKDNLVAGTIQQGEKMKTTNPRRLSRLVLATLALVMLVGLAFVTPQGRALAQRIILFFTVTEEKSFPIPVEQVYSVPTTETPVPTYLLPLQPVEAVTEPTGMPLPDGSCTSLEAQSGYFCQIKTVEAQAGFDAQELPYDPKGMKFSKAAFNPTTETIDMEFEVVTGGGSLYLSQGLGEFPLASKWDKWDDVPVDSIEQVVVNGQHAELVLGAFLVYPNATSAVWEPGGMLRLRWREGDRWFSLTKVGDPYPIEWLGKSEILELAESLVDERSPDKISPVDPEYLTSVEAAEELAGFDVPEPTLLPTGYELKRVVWADNTARLIYGPQGSTETTLFIFMGPLVNSQVDPCFECPPGTVENAQIGPWQGWYWRGIFNMGAGNAVQPTPTPIWEADARDWHLVWNTDTLWISMFYFAPDGYGGEMNKETLVKIAESLK